MSTAEEKIVAPPAAVVPRFSGQSLAWRFVRFTSSVRLGVTLLCLLGLACLIGMLIMQQNVDGFENYYAALTPAQKLLYTRLGFFDIYHVWYFNALLASLSLNIILASFERFPKTWKFVSKPQLTVPVRWLSEQPAHAELESSVTPDEVESVMRRFGWKRVRRAEKGNSTFLFAESGVWNRLGAYPVHVALLTIFLGGFLTAWFGTTGNLPLAPGESSDLIRENVVNLDRVTEMTKQLPFQIAFTDIEQKLIKNDGPLTASNTLDWITRFTINDGGEKTEAMVQMNRPYDYRGYRFFQASFVPVGRARNITIDVTPAGGTLPERVKIDRDGAATLADGTVVRFSELRAKIKIDPEEPMVHRRGYQNREAVLNIVPAQGTLQTAYAFPAQMANVPIASKPVGGYTYRLVDFEKVSDRHVLSVQRDPGSSVVYVGFVLLFLTLVAVFFFSHQRVWVVFTKDGNGSTSIVTAGNVNRNQNGFQDKFSRFVAALRDEKRATETV